MNERKTGQQHWRSLDEFADSERFRPFLEREFPFLPEGDNGPSRRQFLKVMGASLGLAGLTGCRWPREAIVPFASRPEGRTPGIPAQYATAMELGGYGQGLLVRSYEGRPIKIDGNELHPISRGRTDTFAQAALLEMYDPDRSAQPALRHGSQIFNKSWQEFVDETRGEFAALRSAGGAGLLILSEASSSPTIAALRKQLLQSMPQARWFEFEPVSLDNERAGTRLAFGAPYRTLLRLDAADVVAAFDDDFLMLHPASVRYTREFAARRAQADVDRTMNRLYVIENGYTVTGGRADERFAERCADVPIRLCQLAAELLEKGLELPPTASGVAGRLRGFHAGALQPSYLADLAADLLAHRGRALITVGPRQPAEAHALAALLNAALGATGKTVSYIEDADPQRPSHAEAVAAFASALEGEGRTVLLLGGNPVYDAPADLDLAARFGRHNCIHLSLFRNETTAVCRWHVNAAHFLEAWSDTRAWDGTLSIVQPLIAPLYEGKTPAELLALLLGEEDARPYDLVRRTHQASASDEGFEAWWQTVLHDGLVKDSAAPLRAPGVARTEWQPLLDALSEGWTPAREGAFELVFAADYKVYDGRFANNGWLQELPDPITKLTWDNAAIVSTHDAGRLGVRTGDMIELSAAGGALTLPCYVLPGHARGSVTLPLGYGRRGAGVVAEGVGVSAGALRTRATWRLATDVSVKRVRGSRHLATTQDHHAIDSAIGRRETADRILELAREGTLSEYRADAKFVDTRAHIFPLTQLFSGVDYSNVNKWAMTIDLSRCTGCSACVVACQAENNIPVVGRDEVLVGREMHWLRIDRYFTGDPNDERVGVIHQPMPCQHCENAPCEQVCPVAATLHDSDGLNVMVYNRCIGTRYCANNCPYKVRRFNWFYNHYGPKHPRSGGRWAQHRLTAIEMLRHNPEVTVRSRGVMEKCTFCVQRITTTKIRAKNERRPIRDGEVQTACQQVCPADAIVFGDLNDAESAVARAFEHDRGYELLQHLNVRTRNRYLARITNPLHDPHPEGSGKAETGHTG